MDEKRQEYKDNADIKELENEIMALFDGTSENEKGMLKHLINTTAVMTWKLKNLNEGIRKNSQSSLTDFNSFFKNYVTAIKTLMPYLPKEKRKSFAERLNEKLESEDDG